MALTPSPHNSHICALENCCGTRRVPKDADALKKKKKSQSSLLLYGEFDSKSKTGFPSIYSCEVDSNTSWSIPADLRHLSIT